MIISRTEPNGIIKPDWWNLYLRALDYLKEKGAWFGAVREVGEEDVQPQMDADKRR